MATVDNLKKSAKRWLKAIRGGDADSIARFRRAYPSGPEQPGLRDVQHALALEAGLPGWTALTDPARAPAAAADGDDRADRDELATRFLDCACPDHHVRGRPAHRIARHAALRLLGQHPWIAHHNLYTAIACGEVDEVVRRLDQQPDLATLDSAVATPERSGPGQPEDLFRHVGPKGWKPLSYLCFARLPVAAATDNAVAIARALLDRGADPDAHFMAGDSRYTPLTGVVGEGEEDRPPHPQRDPLARLLLERGAEPFDTQVVYNLGFHRRVLWFLQMIHAASIAAGRHAAWQDPDWRMLDMGGYGTGARWHLRIAVEANDLELARWCLEHGARPDPGPERDERLPRSSLYELALRRGHGAIAELLARHGATRTPVALSNEDAFVAACLGRDDAAIERLAADHPELLRSTAAMFAAVRQDRADVVERLLALGVSIEIEDATRQRPLHVAAANDAIAAAALLIERGAEIDPVETSWHNTPIDFAVYNDHLRMAELLARHTCDIGNLVFLGSLPRLRHVLGDQAGPVDSTPLFWLPEDEETALAIIDLLVAHGADPAHRRERDGATAAEVARRRGLVRAAARLQR